MGFTSMGTVICVFWASMIKSFKNVVSLKNGMRPCEKILCFVVYMELMISYRKK